MSKYLKIRNLSFDFNIFYATNKKLKPRNRNDKTNYFTKSSSFLQKIALNQFEMYKLL